MPQPIVIKYFLGTHKTLYLFFGHTENILRDANQINAYQLQHAGGNRHA